MPPTILIVDDEPSLGQVIAQLLEIEGYVTLTLRSPLVALQVLACPSPVSLLITDVRMSDLGGFELARAARGHRPDLPVPCQGPRRHCRRG